MKPTIKFDNAFKIHFFNKKSHVTTSFVIDNNLTVLVNYNSERELIFLINSFSKRYIISNQDHYELILLLLRSPGISQIENIDHISFNSSSFYVQCKETTKFYYTLEKHIEKMKNEDPNINPDEVLDDYELTISFEKEHWLSRQRIITFKLDFDGYFNIDRFNKILDIILLKPQDFSIELIKDFSEVVIEVFNTITNDEYLELIDNSTERFEVASFEFTVDALASYSICLNIKIGDNVFQFRNVSFQMLIGYLKILTLDNFEKSNKYLSIIKSTIRKLKLLSRKIIVGRYFYTRDSFDILNHHTYQSCDYVELLKETNLNLIAECEFDLRFTYKFEKRFIDETFKNLVSGEIDFDSVNFGLPKSVMRTPGFKQIVYPRKAIAYYQSDRFPESANEWLE